MPERDQDCAEGEDAQKRDQRPPGSPERAYLDMDLPSRGSAGAASSLAGVGRRFAFVTTGRLDADQSDHQRPRHRCEGNGGERWGCSLLASLMHTSR